MQFKELYDTVLAISENDAINKKGLSLLYELNGKDLEYINEELFLLENTDDGKIFVPEDSFEVVIHGILIKFRKKT